MRWSEHQRAMLREMGIPAFWPEPAELAGESSQSPVMVAPEAPPAPMAPNEDAPRLSPQAAPAPAVQAPPPARPARVSGQEPVAAPEAAPVRVEVVLGPRPEGIDQMDWPALREAVAQCQACGLCQSRSQAVFGVGHLQAHCMIVGEAPGEQEDLQGQPFVGRSGQLLDRMLEAVGLTRGEAEPAQQVFIANVLKCRPPENRNPQPAEMAQCEPYLMRQIALVQPRVIVAMGRFAAQSLLKTSEPLGRLRGRVHHVQGTPVVVTYHPAYLLRNPVDKGLVWDDLCLAREVLRG